MIKHRCLSFTTVEQSRNRTINISFFLIVGHSCYAVSQRMILQKKSNFLKLFEHNAQNYKHSNVTLSPLSQAFSSPQKNEIKDLYLKSLRYLRGNMNIHRKIHVSSTKTLFRHRVFQTSFFA